MDLGQLHALPCRPRTAAMLGRSHDSVRRRHDPHRRASQRSDQARRSRLPAARRELVTVTGITKQGSTADVEFTWKWDPLNEIGAALYSGDVHYKSVVGFRQYDDGWRMIDGVPRSGQSIDDALKNAEPAP